MQTQQQTPAGIFSTFFITKGLHVSSSLQSLGILDFARTHIFTTTQEMVWQDDTRQVSPDGNQTWHTWNTKFDYPRVGRCTRDTPRSIYITWHDWGPELQEGGAGETTKWMRESLLLIKPSTKTLDASRRDMYKNRPNAHDQGGRGSIRSWGLRQGNMQRYNISRSKTLFQLPDKSTRYQSRVSKYWQ